MSTVLRDAAESARQVAARQFVQALMERYAAYHNHKETMAYSGLTVFAGAVAAALVTNWPPAWGRFTPMLAPLAVVFLFAVTLTYLRFQLRRRRWAALRVSGCERVLAAWVQHSPTDEELAAIPGSFRATLSLWERLTDWIVPREGSVGAFDSTQQEAVYPAALVEKWSNAKKTDAIKHERLIIGTAWVFALALLVRTWCSPWKWLWE